MKKNFICYLNGVSSSGKTSICKILLKEFKEPTIYLSLDNIHENLCDKYNNDDWKLYKKEVLGLHRMAVVWRDQGFNVIIDNILETKELCDDAKEILPDAYFISIKASLETLLKREKDRGRGHYSLVKYQYERVHKYLNYDLELDSQINGLQYLANKIIEKLDKFVFITPFLNKSNALEIFEQTELTKIFFERNSEQLFSLSKIEDKKVLNKLKLFIQNKSTFLINSSLDKSQLFLLGRIYRRLSLYNDALNCFLFIKTKLNVDYLLYYYIALTYQNIGFYSTALYFYNLSKDLNNSYKWNIKREKECLSVLSKKSENGVISCQNNHELQKLSHINTIPGLRDILQCKFLITNIDSDNPILYLFNTTEYKNHYLFYRDILGVNISIDKFDDITYYKNKERKNLAGSIVSHESILNGIYTLEFFSSDPILSEYVNLSFKILLNSLPFIKDRFYYHLNSEVQIDSLNKNKLDSDVKLIDTEELFNHLPHITLNVGESYGILKIIKDEKTIPSSNNIVLYKKLPNDLSNVRGIISDVVQTPLSHVNLKAKQNKIPNIYIKDASLKEEFIKLDGKLICFNVTSKEYKVEEVSYDMLEEKLEKLNDKPKIFLTKNLEQKEIVNLLSNNNSSLVNIIGTKASNISVISNILEKNYTLASYAIPFYFYEVFIRSNYLDRHINQLLEDFKFNYDHHKKVDMLEELRSLILCSELPKGIVDKLNEFKNKFKNELTLRFRSSSNSEDLENFNGAGLYDSFVYNLKEESIEDVVKKVWSSLWTYRAFEERNFHNIEHKDVSMGILIHKNYRNEKFNGVCITKNIFHKKYKGFYINVQTGNSLVTNPDNHAIPEEILISATGKNGKYDIQYLRNSNLISNKNKIMDKEEIVELMVQSNLIHKYFKKYYNRMDDGFAMEIEFLKTESNQLKIMQARPWVE
ncbi:PEP/pyruvate-binding domain-containing protein [Poseidonibacter sp.]|uniref:PEP/pyruvate-binding domain-containing protein n=1 Tax=Poseidonibacter sp. TaxID=2321188 RepID=UPI003C71A798